MKKLKYILFILPFLFYSNVFADTSYDMTSRITSPVNYSECGAGSYTGVELNGATNCWNTKTRYQGTLNRVYFNLPAPTGSAFEPDTAYRLTIKMATDDWRNNFGTVVVSPGSSYTNNFVDTFTFVSMKQVNITFTVPYSGSTTYQYLWVNLPAKNSSSLITGVSNWNLSNVTLTKLTSGSSGGSTTPSGPTTTFDDTAIINSGKENTQDIINNNNSNTEDIINNNNSNTEKINETITENLNNCRDSINLLGLTDFNSTTSNGLTYHVNNGTLTINGTATSNGRLISVPLIDNIILTNGQYYTFSLNATGSITNGNPDVQLRDDSSNILNTNILYFPTTFNNKSGTVKYFAFYVASGTTFNNYQVKPQIEKGNHFTQYEDYGKRICSSKLDDTTNAINNVNDSINNSNVESGTGQGFFDNFTSQDFGLSQIITIPLNTIQSLTTKSCVPLQVPIPFTNSNVSLPCMTQIYETKFPSIYNLWKIVSFGIVAYLIAIDIFHIVKGFKDPESDKVEVLDL